MKQHEELKAETDRGKKKTGSELLDEIFARLTDEAIEDGSFDPGDTLSRISDETLRDQVRRLIDNYVNRADPRKLAPAQELSDRKRLGQFELLGELGRGGMGIVYLARDTSLNRKVALKVLPYSSSRDERTIRRFFREAEAAARLRHKNIIPIYLAGEIDRTSFYSMEYVPGITLAEIIRALRAERFSTKGPLTVQRIIEEDEQKLRLGHKTVLDESKRRLALRGKKGKYILTLSKKNYVHEALELFAGVADALEYAHGEGVVHRDIKPSNLILAPDGSLMLADFGLAKVGGAQSITRTGDFMGSPSYCSPEQAMARRIPQDHRTDIWSLGVTLYEFLTLKHPFAAETIELTLKNVITRDPRSPRALNPRLPKDVETIISKTLEKSPDRRYATAGELASDFRSVLNYESIQAKTVGPITRCFRLVQRNTAVFAVGILSLALILVGGWAYVSFRDQERREVERHFEWVRNIALRPGNTLLDENAVDAIQSSLWRMSRNEDLPTAIDQLGMSRVDRVTETLSHPDESSLHEAMRSLAQVRLVYLHNPDRLERERLERIDRATAESRIQLLWRIADRLLYLDQETGAYRSFVQDAELLWEYLCMFLGTRDLIPGFREENSIVRVNALDAMHSLERYGSRIVGELQRVLNEPALDARIQREAILKLQSTPGLEHDGPALDLLADILRKDQHSLVPFRSRLQIAETLRDCDTRKLYYDVFERLLEDPEPRVRDLARKAMRTIDRG